MTQKRTADNPHPETFPGRPTPLGSTITPRGVNFAIYSPHALAISLMLNPACDGKDFTEIVLDPQINRTGNIWHICVPDIAPGTRYGYRVQHNPDSQHRDRECSDEMIILDPYARATCGGEVWGQPRTIHRGGRERTLRMSIVTDDEYEWEGDRQLNIPLKDTIIYELHVRGFTRHGSSGISKPGTFTGLTEKIPYLKELGVTAVELMPVMDFDEADNPRVNPDTGEQLHNFWGYDPISFFAPKTSYADQSRDDGPLREFKDMVKAFHRAGIEVILDMVFNHTAEKDEGGNPFNFKCLERSVYYLIDEKTNKYLNYSGCGNTLNCNHPIVRNLILDSLRYWVTEMHVDGFRFDLASILGRGRDGEVLSNPPLIERIAEDPVLARTKLIAEAWDAAGLYQVGDFPHWYRWMEWNGRFRDDIRRLVKGDPGMISQLATRLVGSSDLYQDDGREPFHSVNFITAHDGFTLHDLVTYNSKYNRNNGEKNRDGSDINFSWNCGIEGETDDPHVNRLRNKQKRNYLTILLLSQGVPMLLGGDEFSRTQRGNNNAYCQDNDISWVDWQFADTNKDLVRFVRLLVQFRKAHPSLRRSRFQVDLIDGQPELVWHSHQLHQPDWTEDARTLALHYRANPQSDDTDLCLLFNFDYIAHRFQLPAPANGKRWHRVLDTASDSPDDIREPGQEELLTDQSAHECEMFSCRLLISR